MSSGSVTRFPHWSVWCVSFISFFLILILVVTCGRLSWPGLHWLTNYLAYERHFSFDLILMCMVSTVTCLCSRVAVKHHGLAPVSCRLYWLLCRNRLPPPNSPISFQSLAVFFQPVVPSKWALHRTMFVVAIALSLQQVALLPSRWLPTTTSWWAQCSVVKRHTFCCLSVTCCIRLRWNSSGEPAAGLSEMYSIGLLTSPEIPFVMPLAR